MARKRKKLKHLDYQSREYWNRLLAEEGLSMSQGEHPKLIYSPNIERLENGIDPTGRVHPHPTDGNYDSWSRA